jgi:hypothetical protein
MNPPNYFYRDAEKREIGPLPMSAIAQLRQAGILTDETPVRLDNAVEWLTCKTVVAIAGSLAPSTSVPVVGASLGKEKLSGADMQKIGGLFWVFFILAGLSFTLPFFEFTSFGSISLTGQQLILGDKTLNIAPYHYPAAIVAFGLTTAGLLLALNRRRSTSLVSGGFGIGGVVALFVTKSAMENEMAQQAGGMIAMDLKEGFWFVVVFLALAAFGQFKYGVVTADGKDKPQK